MRTTKNVFNVPRILVKVMEADRRAMSEKTIVDKNGRESTLYLNSPWATQKNKDGVMEQQEQNKFTVRYGVIVGMSIGVSTYRKGDIAILDYTVDLDATYIVSQDKDCKIISIPCVTTLCKEEIIATSYDKKYVERNAIVQKKGDIDQLSMVLGVVRDGQFLPNEHYVFCRPPLPEPQSMILFTGPKPEITHIEREVLFAPKNSEVKPGQTIVAIYDSEMPLEIGGRHLEIIPVTDILAIKTQ